MPITFAQYQKLQENLVECAKHGRVLFMTHLSVQGYALIVLGSMTDRMFFDTGKQQTLPLINAAVSPGWFLPALALVSFGVFLHWQLYMRNMWLLDREVIVAAAEHRGEKDFVPPHGAFNWPWVAFIVERPDPVLRIGGAAFAIMQWWLMPTVQYACWLRAVRLGGTLEAWPRGIPFSPGFFGMFVVSMGATLWLRALQGRATEAHVGGWRFTVVRARRTLEGQSIGRPGRWSAAVLLATLLVAGAASWLNRSHALQLEQLHAEGRNFSDFSLSGARLARARLVRADLRHVHAEGADFNGANLSRAKLYWAQLEDADLSDANLSGINLQGANLRRASLIRADLSGAVLSNGSTILGGADRRAPRSFETFNGADLRDATLIGAKLIGADLRGANLSGAELHGADFKGALYSPKTKFPLDFKPIIAGMRKAP